MFKFLSAILLALFAASIASAQCRTQFYPTYGHQTVTHQSYTPTVTHQSYTPTVSHESNYDHNIVYQPAIVYVVPTTPTVAITVYPGQLNVLPTAPIQVNVNVAQTPAATPAKTPALTAEEKATFWRLQKAMQAEADAKTTKPLNMIEADGK